jgi:hypothetical protein
LLLLLYFDVRPTLPRSIPTRGVPWAVWANLPNLLKMLNLYRLYILISCVTLLSIQIVCVRSTHEGVSRTALFKTAPPLKGHCTDIERHFNLKGLILFWCASQVNGAPFNIAVDIPIAFVWFTNICFSVPYVDECQIDIKSYRCTVFSLYNVVSVFSNVFPLALSNITYFCHRSLHLQTTSFCSHKMCSNGTAVLGTTYVWNHRTRDNPGPMICRISPNGD